MHALLIFITGIIFWLMALNKYPFNQKGFEVLDDFRKSYCRSLKTFGTVLIIYSVFIVIEL